MLPNVEKKLPILRQSIAGLNLHQNVPPLSERKLVFPQLNLPPYQGPRMAAAPLLRAAYIVRREELEETSVPKTFIYNDLEKRKQSLSVHNLLQSEATISQPSTEKSVQNIRYLKNGVKQQRSVSTLHSNNSQVNNSIAVSEVVRQQPENLKPKSKSQLPVSQQQSIVTDDSYLSAAGSRLKHKRRESKATDRLSFLAHTNTFQEIGELCRTAESIVGILDKYRSKFDSDFQNALAEDALNTLKMLFKRLQQEFLEVHEQYGQLVSRLAAFKPLTPEMQLVHEQLLIEEQLRAKADTQLREALQKLSKYVDVSRENLCHCTAAVKRRQLQIFRSALQTHIDTVQQKIQEKLAQLQQYAILLQEQKRRALKWLWLESPFGRGESAIAWVRRGVEFRGTLNITRAQVLYSSNAFAAGRHFFCVRIDRLDEMRDTTVQKLIFGLILDRQKDSSPNQLPTTQKNPYQCVLCEEAQGMYLQASSVGGPNCKIQIPVRQGEIIRVVVDFESQIFTIQTSRNLFALKENEISLAGKEWRFMVWLFNTDVQLSLLESE